MRWSVITGDIVASSGLNAAQLGAIMDTLRDASASIGSWHSGGDAESAALFARRAGDAWQIAVRAPALCLRASLYIQSAVIAHHDAHTRLAVATGDGTVPAGRTPDLNSASGPAFVDSGRLLSALPRHALMAHATGGALDAAFRLADHISQGWTQAQARSIHAMLPPGSGPRQSVAHRLGISRQAVDQSLRAAGFAALDAALRQIEAAP
ncbi:MAG: MarR family transcriptional regulator [Pseudomonadota bacterium]